MVCGLCFVMHQLTFLLVLYWTTFSLISTYNRAGRVLQCTYKRHTHKQVDILLVIQNGSLYIVWWAWLSLKLLEMKTLSDGRGSHLNYFWRKSCCFLVNGLIHCTFYGWRGPPLELLVKKILLCSYERKGSLDVVWWDIRITCEENRVVFLWTDGFTVPVMGGRGSR